MCNDVVFNTVFVGRVMEMWGKEARESLKQARHLVWNGKSQTCQSKGGLGLSQDDRNIVERQEAFPAKINGESVFCEKICTEDRTGDVSEVELVVVCMQT
ncbi:hypothetical protein PoB_001823100 [Plakobranchus ocellatus]|uniref:Uncharacterized protein n=1 Tax=Plakobranchus ocellatus TaxID=259542 RepID=A0AAV3Z762_9GAST|nr:hypothetical protein PoB_001823100 [Plakobranchus ocellatus]